jgi:hypothetical protein
VSDPTPAERVAQAWLAAQADATASRWIGATPVAIGWATVELDRATSELAVALGLPGAETFRVAPRSEALGGAVRVASRVLQDGGSLAVLEPDTEGRLAGSLARLGEGPMAVWLAVAGAGTGLEARGRRDLDVSSARAGPFGAERLVLGGPGGTPGRYRLLVVRAPGTIQP